MKMYWEVDAQLHTFLTLALDWSASHPGHFTPGERAPGTPWVGGWVGLRVSLDMLVKKNSQIFLFYSMQTQSNSGLKITVKSLLNILTYIKIP